KTWIWARSSAAMRTSRHAGGITSDAMRWRVAASARRAPPASVYLQPRPCRWRSMGSWSVLTLMRRIAASDLRRLHHREDDEHCASEEDYADVRHDEEAKIGSAPIALAHLYDVFVRIVRIHKSGL